LLDSLLQEFQTIISYTALFQEHNLFRAMSDGDRKVIKARGLPWSATADEVLSFFANCSVSGGKDGIHFTLNREGRPSGECFVEMDTDDDVQEALKKDRASMGKRYVEVFECSEKDMDYALGMSKGAQDDGFGGDFGDDGVVRLRGLPFEASKDEVADFFGELEIEENGILMVADFNGRASGEAFVQFTNSRDAERALGKNKASMGRRYIEVFKSSMEEAKMAQGRMMGGYGGPPPPHMRGGPGPMRGGYGAGPMGRPGPYDRMRGGYGGGMGYGGGPPHPPIRAGMGPGRGGYGGGMGAGSRHVVHMRGLPFRVTEQEIAEWFSSAADPVDVMIHYNHDGRPSGEADAMFASEAEANRAMSKNKQNMQHRYVELFYDGGEGF